jgi:hypothetical protein
MHFDAGWNVLIDVVNQGNPGDLGCGYGTDAAHNIHSPKTDQIEPKIQGKPIRMRAGIRDLKVRSVKVDQISI